jgi:hypothetical protein
MHTNVTLPCFARTTVTWSKVPLVRPVSTRTFPTFLQFLQLLQSITGFTAAAVSKFDTNGPSRNGPRTNSPSSKWPKTKRPTHKTAQGKKTGPSFKRPKLGPFWAKAVLCVHPYKTFSSDILQCLITSYIPVL